MKTPASNDQPFTDAHCVCGTCYANNKFPVRGSATHEQRRKEYFFIRDWFEGRTKMNQESGLVESLKELHAGVILNVADDLCSRLADYQAERKKLVL